jgi:chemotaxis signal transduction protein
MQEYFGVKIGEVARLAIPLTATETILRITLKDICPIPGVNPYLIGVVNQAGSLLWLFNLPAFLGVHLSSSTQSSLVVVIAEQPSSLGESEKSIRRIGCIVADLEGIFVLDVSSLQPMPPQVSPSIRHIFKGLMIRQLSSGYSPYEIGASSNPVRVAVLDPPALFEYLQGVPHQPIDPLRISHA